VPRSERERPATGLHDPDLVDAGVADPQAVRGEPERERALADGDLAHVARVGVEALALTLRRVRAPHGAEAGAHVLG
jgi:hypothetical protein